MTFLAWLRCTLGASPLLPPEKEAIVGEIEREMARLDKATVNLEKEVDTIKRSRVEMGRILDDALRAMQKEFRK